MRRTTVTVGPLASASATALCASQKAPGAFALALDSTLSSGYSATSLAASQAVAGAGDLTLTSAAGVWGGKSVVVVSAGNDSGITFTVKGTAAQAGVTYFVSEVLTGANVSRVATRTLFQTVTSITASGAAAGNVSAGSNGLITMDFARRVLITSAGNDSGMTFAISGTDWAGNPCSETLTGGNATTAQSVYDYTTVTSIYPSAATASTVTVGTSGVASSRPIFLDTYGYAPTSIQVTVSGTANYTVQQTLDNADSASTRYTGVTWVNHPDSSLAAATATAQGNYAYIPRMCRITLNSGSGSVVMTIIQAGPI